MNTTQLTNQEIAASMGLYGVSATNDLCDKIRAYIAILLKWNQKISLTTVTGPAEILRFHFGESLFAASAAPIRHGRLADVGSGAGFPGLAIRLLVETIEVVLIESNTKKTAFLSEVTRELGLRGVEIFRGRMDDFDSGAREINLITARALGQHENLLKWSHSRLDSSGKLIMWLGEEDANEISRSPSWIWHEPIKIPQSQRRFLLIGSPVK
jgi:16S rRNA (guanine527-N7)-methyltransferase